MDFTNSTTAEALGASPGILQSCWSYYISRTGNDFFTHYFIGASTLYELLYIFYGGMFVFMDLTGMPASFKKYKIQDKANMPLDITKVWKLMPLVFLNEFILTPSMNGILAKLHIYFHGPRTNVAELPGIHEVITHLLFFLIFSEIWMYYAHWAMHQKFLYKHVHYVHHEWTAPIAWQSVYCHPIEHIFANILSVALGPLILGSHVSLLYFWGAFATTVSLTTHSGYHLPFLRSSEYHDYHHLKFNQNFGVVGFLDMFHGTSKRFTSSVQGLRHRVLYSSKSAKELYPDNKKSD